MLRTDDGEGVEEGGELRVRVGVGVRARVRVRVGVPTMAKASRKAVSFRHAASSVLPTYVERTYSAYWLRWYSAAIAAIDCIIVTDCRLGTFSAHSRKFFPKCLGSSLWRKATPQR